MAKFLRAGSVVVNLDSIDYVELNIGSDAAVVMHFNGQDRTLRIAGEEGEDLKTYLSTEQAFERGFLG